MGSCQGKDGGCLMVLVREVRQYEVQPGKM